MSSIAPALTLAVTTWDGGRRSALLLHGLSSNGAGWWRLGPELAEAGFRVVAPDLRGHGESPPGGDYRLESYAGDVLALGDRWDLVVGHSLGGAIALVAAARHARHWARLVLEDPVLVVEDIDATVDWIRESFTPPLTADAVHARNPSWHPEDARIKAAALAASDVEVAERTFRQNDPWDVTPLLTGVEVPTLILGAATGALVPPELGARLAASNDLISFQTVAGSSHSMHRDRYGDFLAAILSFLDR